jgi:hypothetical protein
MIGQTFILHFGLANANPFYPSALALQSQVVPSVILSHDNSNYLQEVGPIYCSEERYRHTKVIFLVRDPRDVIVSRYFHRTKRNRDYSEELSDFLREPVGGFDHLITFYNVWAESQHVPKGFLLVHYEDLHQNAHQELRRVMDFLGLTTISDAVLAEVVKGTTFCEMRKMEEEDRFDTFQLRPADRDDKESYKTRRGQIGGFRDYVSAADLSELEQKMQNLSPIFGYSPIHGDNPSPLHRTDLTPSSEKA